MSRRATFLLLNAYLIFRIVVCPCLSGENFHDRATRCFFGWAGSATIPSDDLAGPDAATEAGACLCDGAVAPMCIDLPPPALSADPLDPPGPAALAPLGLEIPTPHPSPLPLTIGPPPVGAAAARAQLQNFRC